MVSPSCSVASTHPDSYILETPRESSTPRGYSLNPNHYRVIHESRFSCITEEYQKTPFAGLVVVKHYNPRITRWRINFQREIEFLRICHLHPSFVQVLDHSLEQGRRIVFEQCLSDLGQYINFHGSLQGRLQVHECWGFLYQVFSGLSFLHDRGVTHNSIRPQHLLLKHDLSIKITGLDSAFIVGHDTFESGCHWSYAAPEVYMGSGCITQQSDIWSAGCVFGEMLQGDPLFPDTSRRYIGDRMSRLGVPLRDRTHFRLSPLMNFWVWPAICYDMENWCEVIPNLGTGPAEYQAVTFLLQLLQFNSSLRPSAATALDFLSVVRDENSLSNSLQP